MLYQFLCVCLCTGVYKKHTHTSSDCTNITAVDSRAGEFKDNGKRHVLTWTWIWRSYFWNTENRMDYTHTHNTHIDRYTTWQGWFERDKGERLSLIIANYNHRTLSFEQITPCKHIYSGIHSKEKNISKFGTPPISPGVNKTQAIIRNMSVDCPPL